ncbi:MAG: hypothetical protein SVW77_03565 [Candidatus Nanohaloarchaea archaeon]|nr:hypothetical protein [Candidatus Nanohaloarchaea archaeon]
MASTARPAAARPPSGTGDRGDARPDRSARPRRAAATAGLTALGVGGRAAFQHVPSVEPLIAVAVVAGFYGNWRHGAAAGAAGYTASNFLVWGGQGPWTVFQVIGGGLAGLLAGILGAWTDDRRVYLAALVLGVLGFETVINLGTLVFMPAAVLAAAAPYAAIHLVSTAGFGVIVHGLDGYLTTLYRIEHGSHRCRDSHSGSRHNPGAVGPSLPHERAGGDGPGDG